VLVPVPQSTVSVAYGSSPSQALIASQGALVFGADFLGGMLQSFRLDQQGHLNQNLPQALPDSIFAGLTGGHQPLGMRTHPTLPILYVDITPVSEVAVYSYDKNGQLSFVRTVSDSGMAPCWAVVDHAGTRLYATNTGDNSIAVYDLADLLNPVQIQHFVMASTTGAAFSTVIDHSDSWIYVSSEQSSGSATAAANAFHALKVAADGTLTEPSSDRTFGERLYAGSCTGDYCVLTQQSLVACAGRPNGLNACPARILPAGVRDCPSIIRRLWDKRPSLDVRPPQFTWRRHSDTAGGRSARLDPQAAPRHPQFVVDRNQIRRRERSFPSAAQATAAEINNTGGLAGLGTFAGVHATSPLRWMIVWQVARTQNANAHACHNVRSPI
jgi:hypothetical protein